MSRVPAFRCSVRCKFMSIWLPSYIYKQWGATGLHSVAHSSLQVCSLLPFSTCLFRSLVSVEYGHSSLECTSRQSRVIGSSGPVAQLAVRLEVYRKVSGSIPGRVILSSLQPSCSLVPHRISTVSSYTQLLIPHCSVVQLGLSC